MGGIFGQNKTMSTKDTQLNAMKITQSTYGIPIQLIFGTTRATGNVIEYEDFTAIPHVTEERVGGGKGGGTTHKNETYSYTAAAFLGLCEGPIVGIRTVYKDKEKKTLADTQFTLFKGVLGQTPWGYMTTKHPDKALGYNKIAYLAGIVDLPDGSVPNYSFEVIGLCTSNTSNTETETTSSSELFYTDNLAGTFTLSVSTDVVITSVTGTIYYNEYNPGGGEGGDSGGYFRHTREVALSYTAVDNVVTVAPWENPEESLTSISISYTHTTSTTTYTVQDVKPIDIINKLFTDPVYGVGFSSQYVADTSEYEEYCSDLGISLSMAIDSQTEVKQIIEDEICRASNSTPVWSQGKLKFIPYYDGLSPVYIISEDDIIDDEENSITTTRTEQADAFNQQTVEFIDRSNDYNTQTHSEDDLANIDMFGLRPADPISFKSIHTLSVAQTVARLLLQRSLYIRNKYTFKLPWNFVLLDPMDIIQLVIPTLDINELVRIISIKESGEQETLEIECEEYPTGVSSPLTYNPQGAFRPSINYNNNPGSINYPVIFSPPATLMVNGYEIWIAVSGNSANWGGCSVWVSDTGENYRFVGKINNPARHGILTDTIVAGSALDTTNTLKVDLTTSKGTLTGGTTSDAENLNTLCYVGGEMMAFRDATLTDTNKYNLSYLVREAYGTLNSRHLAGAPFVRIDDAIFKYSLTSDQIGRSVYAKFTSFNNTGGLEQSLDEVPEYIYTISAQTPEQILNVEVWTTEDGSILIEHDQSERADFYEYAYYVEEVTE